MCWTCSCGSVRSRLESALAASAKCCRSTGRGPFTVATAQGEFAARAVDPVHGPMVAVLGFECGRSRQPKWIGLKAHYRERNPPLQHRPVFLRQWILWRTAGVARERKRLRSGALRLGDDAARGFPPVAAASGQSRTVGTITDPVSTAPVLYRKPDCVRDGILLAGDAAGFIDPFAGDGISLALRSGQAAAKCLRPFLAGEASLDSRLRRNTKPCTGSSSLH